jgi:hypothetical protein
MTYPLYGDLPASGSIAIGSTGHESWHEDIHDGLKASDYYVPNSGGDMRSDIQTAINDAETDNGGEVVLDRGITLIATQTLTDSFSDPVGLRVPPRVFLRGQGMGSGRSGSGDEYAPTVLKCTATAADDFALVAFDNSSPDWRGGGIRDIHLMDNGTEVDHLLRVSGLNGMMIKNVSFSEAAKSGSKCIYVKNSFNSQPTQYGRIWNCNIWASNHGIWTDGNNPDWEIHGTQNQHDGGATPVAGSTGLYVDSNAWRIYGGETQFYDIGHHVDGSNSRGKHFKLFSHHFEGHQGAAADAYDSMFKATGTGDMYPLLVGAEYANSGKYTTPINIGSGVTGTKLAFNLVRDSRWITTTGDSLITDNGTGTVVI